MCESGMRVCWRHPACVRCACASTHAYGATLRMWAQSNKSSWTRCEYCTRVSRTALLLIGTCRREKKELARQLTTVAFDRLWHLIERCKSLQDDFLAACMQGATLIIHERSTKKPSRLRQWMKIEYIRDDDQVSCMAHVCALSQRSKAPCYLPPSIWLLVLFVLACTTDQDR